MNSNLNTSIHGVVVSQKQATQLSDVVEAIIEQALSYARMRISTIHQPQDQDVLFQQQNFMCTFKYGLADGVGQAIGLYDEHVSEIYLFEPCLNPDSESGEELPVDGTINLILLVSSATAGLEAFVASLDRALTKRLKELPLVTLAAYSSVLNPILVTQKDLEQGRGYAALITSIHTPPIKIWQRLQ